MAENMKLEVYTEEGKLKATLSDDSARLADLPIDDFMTVSVRLSLSVCVCVCVCGCARARFLSFSLSLRMDG